MKKILKIRSFKLLYNNCTKFWYIISAVKIDEIE